ncbi:amino acid ABC transporter substrate-binding protein [Piscinibacter gummiphilus]|uniref:ABC transporter substrate-binding protein n=1 Tax=Piscinibacter gummiphilus TaxID=946333 RepID=A0A1W6L2U0_9BURK|nr:amino acid ABC transporter substrate-binding protein [Piscinibacter gummiphilus]ARN18478.1 ABC transporter substrate-binding protein [Piscinibacter gummiphilus]ATU63104.1 amino acid ABC transporter substrate-binding protein [Piscinibacter gummiphilus]GLS95418.1 glutamate/aspartate ABC transporter substrate-binding protein [Piscinibacter gummiphilus]
MFTLNRVVLSLLGAAAAFAAHAQPASTLAKMAESGTITLSYRESSVPFSYLDNAKPIGFSVEVCDRIVDELKAKVKRPDLKIERMPVTSQNRIPLVQNGTVDLECGSTTNNSARGEQVAFAVNYFYTGTRLMAKKTAGIKSLMDLKGKKVATTAGTTNFQVLRKYFRDNNLDTEIITAKDHADGALLAENGRVEAYAMDDILLYGLVANSKAPADWVVTGEPLQVEPYAIMLRKNDPEFKKAVDDALIGLMKSGEFEKLYAKWFLNPIPPRKVPLNVPMSDELKANLKAFSDKPAT